MAPTNSQKRTVGETLNTWTQTVGICIAAVWGVYTFVFKEIITPKSAPVNVSMNLQLNKIGTGSSAKANLTAVQLNVSATNPRTREIHLLPSAWIARGVRIRAAKQEELEETYLTKAINDALLDRDVVYAVQKYAAQEDSSVIAGGLLFTDDLLKPNEKIARTAIFYVSRDQYDLLDVNATIVSAEDVSHTAMDWALNPQSKDLETVFYRVDKKGTRNRIENSDARSDKRLSPKWTQASSEISLWP